MEVYCVHCEEMVHLEEGESIFGHLAFIPILDDSGRTIGVDPDLCEFPAGYTFVAPPPVEPDWIDSVVERGSNELEIDLESFEPEYEFDELDDENVPSGDFFMTPTQYVGL